MHELQAMHPQVLQWCFLVKKLNSFKQHEQFVQISSGQSNCESFPVSGKQQMHLVHPNERQHCALQTKTYLLNL